MATGGGQESRVASYTEHPLVSKAQELGEEPPFPLGMSINGENSTAQHAGRTDSIVAFMIINLVSKKRHDAGGLRTLFLQVQMKRMVHCFSDAVPYRK